MNPSVNPSEKHSGSHSSIKKAVITFGLIFFGACQLLGCEKWMGEPLNCAVRERHETTPPWGCRKASRWAASCVPAAEFVNWGCLDLDASVSFCAPPTGTPPLHFNITVLMKKSGVSLDCNNQIIDHSVRVTPETVLGDTSAILASIDHSLSDIEVKNCKIKNVNGYGVGLKRLFRGAELNPVNGVPPALLGHSNIRVDNTTIENAKYFGIYVGQNSNAIAITKTKITHSFGGIYLEAGTSNSLISEVEIRNSFDREAIAVDASHHNIIEKSIFSGNPGGIKLYKNCGETTGSVCPILREQGSNFNTIRGNTFEGDSLQIASRQFIYYGFGWCEGTSGRGGIWNDVAESNTVSDNTFNNTLFEVRHTPVFIRGNRFNSTRVSLGTPAPPRETEIRMTGEMTGNILGPGSSVVLNQSSSYFSGFKIESNRTDTGACAPFNSCP